MNIFINFGIYQVIWFLCVFLENLGALLAIPLLVVHFYFTPYRSQDGKMTAILLLVGIIIDGTLHALGYINYNVLAYPIPFWLAVIWLALATLPHHSLSWLKGRYLLSAFFGFLGGPLAYWAGVRVGAASFNWPLPASLITLATIWAVLWPIVMYVAGKNLSRTDNVQSLSLSRNNINESKQRF